MCLYEQRTAKSTSVPSIPPRSGPKLSTIRRRTSFPAGFGHPAGGRAGFFFPLSNVAHRPALLGTHSRAARVPPSVHMAAGRSSIAPHRHVRTLRPGSSRGDCGRRATPSFSLFARRLGPGRARKTSKASAACLRWQSCMCSGVAVLWCPLKTSQLPAGRWSARPGECWPGPGARHSGRALFRRRAM